MAKPKRVHFIFTFFLWNK